MFIFILQPIKLYSKNKQKQFLTESELRPFTRGKGPHDGSGSKVFIISSRDCKLAGFRYL